MCSDSGATCDLSFANYQMWDGCSGEIEEVTKKYPDLKATMAKYFPNNGPNIKPQWLVSLTGTVAVSKEKIKTSNIPVVIWVPTHYPREMPDVFLVPTSTVIPTQNVDDEDVKSFVGPTGRVNLRILRADYKPEYYLEGGPDCYDLENIVDSLVAALSKWSPERFGFFVNTSETHDISRVFPSLTIPLKLKRNVKDITKELENCEVDYPNRIETAKDVLKAATWLRKSKPVIFNYFHNNGTLTGETILAVSGTLVILKKQEIRIGAKAIPPKKKSRVPQLRPPDNRPALNQVLRYEIPVWTWFPKDYPTVAPIVFVKRSKYAPMKSNLDYLSQYGEVDFGKEFEWEDSSLEELLERVTSKLHDNPPVRHLSSEIKSGSDEELEANESDSDDEPDEEVKLVPLDAAIRLFLSAQKKNECQNVKNKLGELLKAKRERNRVNESVLSDELLKLLRDPKFLKDWDLESSDVA